MTIPFWALSDIILTEVTTFLSNAYIKPTVPFHDTSYVDIAKASVLKIAVFLPEQ
jgi:hypothetical protein